MIDNPVSYLVSQESVTLPSPDKPDFCSSYVIGNGAGFPGVSVHTHDRKLVAKLDPGERVTVVYRRPRFMPWRARRWIVTKRERQL
jgi:hypothetical protein